MNNSNQPDLIIRDILAKENTIAIYTDGNKSQNSTSAGSSTACPELNKIVSISTYKEASIFTAECIGILFAIELAITNPTYNYIIFTDSLSAVMAIENTKINIHSNPYIYHIKNKIIEFYNKSKDKEIQIMWIPGHKPGLVGNDIADKVAKEASKLPPDHCCKIPFSDLKGFFRNKTTENTILFINESSKNKGSIYFNRYYKCKSKPWFHNKHLTREIITTINRIRSEHYSLNSSLAECNLVDNPHCDCNNQEYIQDIEHILWQCITFEQQRKEFITGLLKQKLQLPLASFVILHKPTIGVCKSLQNFFKDCNLLI
ncbi:uncharacterized protein [Prorops nasuta]|uniref:uncharacterized protein n=1 Tax=Prorops nasuta TaxID=863751 RepID=UPI0034CDD309